jgi:hypothetical protein
MIGIRAMPHGGGAHVDYRERRQRLIENFCKIEHYPASQGLLQRKPIIIN